MKNIGFMQGRLSEVVGGVIQEFPWKSWEDEFIKANEIGIHMMEWTLDQKDLYTNPIMTVEGQIKIRQLCDDCQIKIPSLTGDCFMQAPFWKYGGSLREDLVSDFFAIIKVCGQLNIGIIVIPLVDGGSLKTLSEEKILIDVLQKAQSLMTSLKIKIAFESDFPPSKLAKFIRQFEPEIFGINYDIGNRASLGFNIDEEFTSYGDSILNVHVKDRPLGGTTVPLGEGNADFEAVFAKLSECGYKGNYILQTARDASGQHSEVIKHYLDKTINWIAEYES
jgi:hexulose-6-phosphate isomerase